MKPSTFTVPLCCPLMVPKSAPKNWRQLFLSLAACCSHFSLRIRNPTSDLGIFQCAKTPLFVSERTVPSS
eukprot:8879842-Pyramimonas_sp.AAC.1